MTRGGTRTGDDEADIICRIFFSFFLQEARKDNPTKPLFLPLTSPFWLRSAASAAVGVVSADGMACELRSKREREIERERERERAQSIMRSGKAISQLYYFFSFFLFFFFYYATGVIQYEFITLYKYCICGVLMYHRREHFALCTRTVVQSANVASITTPRSQASSIPDRDELQYLHHHTDS